MTIAYVAYTEGNVLMLDSEGVCVRVEPLRSRMPYGPRPAPTDGALRCIGAQFVASIDPSEPGGLAHLPRVGTSMLFAAVDQDGRIYCVRAGPLTHFEATANEGSEPGRSLTGPNGTARQDSLAWEDPRPEASSSSDLRSSDSFDSEVETWVRVTPLPPSGDRDSDWLHEPGPFNDTTDPGFSVSLHDIEPMESEPETAPYPSTRYSHAGFRFSHSTPVPAPPPLPRLPRIQTTAVTPLPSRHVPMRGSRAPANGAAAPPRRPPAQAAVSRPPAPSSHAWLRSSPAAERRWR
jgi:hypothetical protein